MENGNSELLNDVKWNCLHCTRSFDSRGKRNGHFNKEHRKKCIINGRDIDKNSVKRSEQNKFACPCGKSFLHAQSLQRHTKGCIGPNYRIPSSDPPMTHKFGGAVVQNCV